MREGRKAGGKDAGLVKMVKKPRKQGKGRTKAGRKDAGLEKIVKKRRRQGEGRTKGRRKGCRAREGNEEAKKTW